MILINIDDLGYSDIGPFGGKVPTPALDRMAAEGMLLRSHYAAPLCSPSRAAMMTGCYPKRVLPIPGVLFPAAHLGLHPDELTIAEILKPQGYATLCIGKWHLGDQAEFLPTKQGFDYYYGIPYSNDMGPRSEGSKSNPGKETQQPTKASNAASPDTNQSKAPASTPASAPAKPTGPQPVDETGLKGDAQPPLPLLENDQVVERVKAAEQFTFTRRYTDKAVELIRKHRDQPFFLYLPHNAVHFPHYPHKDFMGKSGVSLQKDWTMEIDDSVGQVIKALREVGIEKKTLVIFTSDNGGPVNQGADNGPLKGAKGSTWEGGMRVCTIAWWPGRIAPGSQTNEITAHMDWLPTFASLAKSQLPQDRKFDGKDLSPLLLQTPNATGHDSFLYFRGLELEAVRQKDWKLHLAKNELFDLTNDLGETNNVADTQPELVAKLRSIAESTNGDLGLKGKASPGVRKLGRVESPKPLISSDGTVCEDANRIRKTLP